MADRIAPLTGALFVILIVIGFTLAGEPPDPKQSEAAEVVEFWSDNKDTVQITAAIITLAGGLFVFFGAYMRSLLRERGDDGTLPTVAFAGTVALAVGLGIDAMLGYTLGQVAEDVNESSLLAIAAIWDNDFFPLVVGTFLFLIGTGLSVARHPGALPRWLGWLMLALGAIAVTPIGFVSFMAMGLIVLGISITLAVRAGRSGTMPPDEPARAPAPAA